MVSTREDKSRQALIGGDTSHDEEVFEYCNQLTTKGRMLVANVDLECEKEIKSLSILQGDQISLYQTILIVKRAGFTFANCCLFFQI
jgi:precorrin-6B methylase 2